MQQQIICENCGYRSSLRFCGECGNSLKAENQRDIIVRSIFSPFIELRDVYIGVIANNIIITDVRNGVFGYGNLIKFLLSSVAISSILRYVFHIDTLIPFNIPVVTDVAESIFIIVLGPYWTIFWYLFLNRKSKNIKLIQHTIATSIIIGLVYPAYILLRGLLKLSIDLEEFAIFIAFTASLIYLVKCYTVLYNKNIKDVSIDILLGFFVGPIAVMLIVAIIFAVLFIIISFYQLLK